MDWLKKNFDYCFLALAIIELGFVQYYPEGRMVTKPLLMISLMVYYALSSMKIDWLFLSALFFAFLGDTFLLSDDLFLYGLGSFLLMQILYAICFYKQRGVNNRYKAAGIGIIILLTATILYSIVPGLGKELRIPVIIYSASIGLMAVAAIMRKDQGAQYRFILGGVVCFLISDSLLGINKFGGGFQLAGLLVMLTYISAQYLIVKGYLKYEWSNNAS